MPTFSGKFEHRSGTGTVQQGGSCRLTFDDESFRLVTEKGPGLAFDLGDIDVVEVGDYQLSLKVYDGTTVLLNQFGKAFQQVRHDLLESWRKRLVQCLLLEDLRESTRLDGYAQLDSAERRFSSPVEIRLYKSNLAILPATATAFQWRLADIDMVDFDAATYTLGLRSGSDRLILTRLAKRTREFAGQLRDTMESNSDKTAQVLHALFPFLTPDQFCQVAAFMKEGRTVPLSQLASINPLTEKALTQNAVSPALRPYFNTLKQRVVPPGCYAGFKLVRKEEAEQKEEEVSPETQPEGAEVEGAGAESQTQGPLLDLGEESLLCWFFFPLKSTSAGSGGANLVAWECTSQSGRATYVFRLPTGQDAQIDDAIQRLNRGIVLVNFRREPIYLSNNALEIQPCYRRYAIAQRNIAELRQVRQSLVGRAIHTTVQAWQSQLEGLAK